MVLVYYVVFSKGSNKFVRFLEKGFGHVYLFGKDKFNWFLIEPAGGFLRINILPNSIDAHIRDIAVENDCKILEVKTEPDVEKVHSSIFGCISCSTVVKYILGIKGIAWTPYMLYKGLQDRRFKNILTVKEV